jgi:thiol-disulfide isomerase/thioredoxin
MVDRDDRLVIGAASADESTGVGSAFVDFDLPGLDGDGKIRLSDYRGRVVVVNVWASWCAPCRLEMPALDSLAGEFAPKHVTILGLNDDEDPDAARRFVRSLGGVRYPLGAGMGALQERFDLRGLPYTVVLDRDHRIIEEISGFGGTLEPVRRAIAIALDTASGRNSP